MRRVARAVAIVCAWAIVVVVVGLLVARHLGVTQITLVAFLVGMPYAAIPVAIALVLFLVLRSRIGAVVAGVLVAITVAIQVPMFLAGSPNADGPSVTVLTINAAHGDADAQQIVEAVRANEVDVLAVQELTQAEADSLDAAGLSEVMPYAFTEPRPVADGTGLWSRTPLTDGTRLENFGFVPVQAQTVIGGRTVTLVSFHAMSPATPAHTIEWDADLHRMRALMADYPGTVIVAGDFNATDDHRQFRDLASAPFADAAEVAGSGLFRTFPADEPLARLDHVVTSDDVAVHSVGPVNIDGSDHLGVLAELRIP